jgi:hypothetical protein
MQSAVVEGSEARWQVTGRSAAAPSVRSGSDREIVVRQDRCGCVMRPSDIQSFAERSRADIEAIARDPARFAAMRGKLPTWQRWLTARSARSWRRRALRDVDVLVAGMRKG